VINNRTSHISPGKKEDIEEEYNEDFDGVGQSSMNNHLEKPIDLGKS
jgi:hypothetical protein